MLFDVCDYYELDIHIQQDSKPLLSTVLNDFVQDLNHTFRSPSYYTPYYARGARIQTLKDMTIFLRDEIFSPFSKNFAVFRGAKFLQEENDSHTYRSLRTHLDSIVAAIDAIPKADQEEYFAGFVDRALIG